MQRRENASDHRCGCDRNVRARPTVQQFDYAPCHGRAGSFQRHLNLQQ